MVPFMQTERCPLYSYDLLLAFLSFQEYMDRGTIADLLEKAGPIPESYLGRISYDIICGLEYLHKTLHLIHRY